MYMMMGSCCKKDINGNNVIKSQGKNSFFMKGTLSGYEDLRRGDRKITHFYRPDEKALAGSRNICFNQ